MDVGAAIVGVVLGALAGLLADVVATNAPARAPLLRRVRLSRAAPFVIAAAAGLGGACGLAFGFELEALVAVVFCWILVAISRTDLEHRLIPDRIVLPGTALVVAGRTIDDPSLEWIVAALGAGLVLFLVVLVYPRGMGMGDVKLALLLGAGLGVDVIPGLFVGFFLAFVPAFALVLRHGRAAGKLAIPLGPFLAVGAVVALFAGEAIIDWYVELGR